MYFYSVALLTSCEVVRICDARYSPHGNKSRARRGKKRYRVTERNKDRDYIIGYYCYLLIFLLPEPVSYRMVLPAFR